MWEILAILIAVVGIIYIAGLSRDDDEKQDINSVNYYTGSFGFWM